MNKKSARLIPLLTAGIVPATAITTGLMSAPAEAAPGDLDPGFGDVGRLGPILDGPAWSLELQDDGSMLLAGGRYYPGYYYWGYYYSYATNFVSQLSATGTVDPGFAAAPMEDTQVLDVARQTDGLVVAAGLRIGALAGSTHLVVFRLQADGSLDQAFADAGVFQLSSVDYGDQHRGTSMLLDPDGRIVVAGSQDTNLLVVRLLPDGSLDDSFGTLGVVTAPGAGTRSKILRTAGGYRVAFSDPAGCRILALTADGASDSTFGTAGIATVDGATGPASWCNSMVAQADGSLVVAGVTDGRGFAARMLADGQPDAGFDASAVASALSNATAVAVGQDDSVVVAGTGVSGDSIMRLQATGELDVLFGDAGSTFIDLPSDSAVSAVVHDIQVAADGSVLATGGADNWEAFVVRLLGTGGGDSPGVVGVAQRSYIQTVDGSDEVVVKVRRTGGDSGTVSVAYQTVPVDGQSATSGLDYNPVSGRLTWVDGDRAEQEIQVQILSGGSVDPYELFGLELSDVDGGAGLGLSKAVVQIAADGAPFGQLGFVSGAYGHGEFGSVTVQVSRDFYSTGAVSVTLTPVAGTATAGSDFIASPVTLTWADGESGSKSAAFAIVDDTEEEPSENFTIELSNPTGGALLGPRSTTAVSIARSDQPAQNPKPKSKGGGAMGFLSLLLLGVMSVLRSARTRVRKYH